VAEREEEARRETVEGSEGVVRLVSYPVTDPSGETIAVVQTAESRRTFEATVRRLVFVLVSVGLGSLLLAGLGGLFVSGRAMRPVRDSFRRQRTFIADASHELKTPLALVKIDAEVMRRNPADPDNAGIVEDQLAEIDRMDALLSDLLTLARLDAGRLDVEAKPFDLAVVAVEAAGRFLKRAAAEGVRLEVDAPDELPASGDAGKTAQVLAALLDNAVRYTPEGGTVTVAARHRNGRAEATVTDAGPGIPPEHLPRVFDRFYRAEEARTRKGGGTGLGLAIARDLARAQSGDLSAENTPDGARFSLTILAAP
jgi:signal transduction histidine kinase